MESLTNLFYELSAQVAADFSTLFFQNTANNTHPDQHVSRRLSGTPGYVTFIVLVVISALMLYMLRTLKGISDHWAGKMKGRIKKALEERKEMKDSFRQANGYRYEQS